MSSLGLICENGGVLVPSNQSCFCTVLYAGTRCEQFAADVDIGYKAVLICWGILSSLSMVWALWRTIPLALKHWRLNRRTQAFACTLLTIIAAILRLGHSVNPLGRAYRHGSSGLDGLYVIVAAVASSLWCASFAIIIGFWRTLLATKGNEGSFRRPRPFTWLGAVVWFIIALGLMLTSVFISLMSQSRFIGIAHAVFVCVTLVGYSASILYVSRTAVSTINKSSYLSSATASPSNYSSYLGVISRFSFGAAFCIFIHGLGVGINLLLNELWLRNLDTSDALRWSTALFLILFELTDSGLAIMFVSLLSQRDAKDS